MSQILVRGEGDDWSEPRVRGFKLEDDLQEILAEHPELIPGVAATAVACREFQSEVGPADIVVVDEGGQVTVVECKLATNPQIRREIIGQLFDYASRLWRMDIDEFSRRWRARTGQPLFEPGDAGVALRDAVEANLASGRFRLVLAVDEIREPLKRMVEYLNAMSGPETSVIAVEYRRFWHGGIEVLMPQKYGQELAESKISAESPKTWWSEETYRAWLEEHQPEVLHLFNSFLGSAATYGWNFTGSFALAPAGSLTIANSAGVYFGKISIYYFERQGVSLEFNLSHLMGLSDEKSPSPAELETFLDAFEAIPGLAEMAGNLRASSFRSRGPNVGLVGFDKEQLRQVLCCLSNLTEAKLVS